jgi:peptidoglycan-N-acetylglucosamine deacetylase
MSTWRAGPSTYVSCKRDETRHMQKRLEQTKNVTDSGRELGCVFVTTSWDDGHILDHRLAALLDAYGLRGTFYVAPRNVELPRQERLRTRDLQILARQFEIGGHTLTHLRLTSLPDAVARKELVEGKDSLEQVIGVPLRCFCYPGGQYSDQHPAMVREAGFELARTARRGVTGLSPRYETHTTVHAYRHLVDGPAAIRLAGGNLKKAGQIYWNWDVLATTMFDQVLTTRGVFHLWGHSWEIEQNKDWDRLERVLSYIGNRSNVKYLDNGELADIAR